MSKKFKNNKKKINTRTSFYRRTSNSWKVAYIILGEYPSLSGKHVVIKAVGYTEKATIEDSTIKLGTIRNEYADNMQLMTLIEVKLIVEWLPRSKWKDNEQE